MVNRPQLIGLTLVGKNLLVPPTPGWTVADVIDGRRIRQIRMGEHCHDSAIQELEEKHSVDCKEYRSRLDEWVATGTMPQSQVKI